MDFNLADLNEAVTAAVGDREAIIFGERRITYAQLRTRTNQLANYLLGAGFTVRAERDQIEGWESGQDHLALYLYNGNEYVEGMLGAYKSRVAPFNVNYRYVSEELLYLLDDSQARGIIYHSAFAPVLQAVRAELPRPRAAPAGRRTIRATPCSKARSGTRTRWPPRSSEPPAVVRSPDDLYILYTGGTTGMPKGVLWRQGDIYPAALGGRQVGTGQEWADRGGDRRQRPQRRGPG